MWPFASPSRKGTLLFHNKNQKRKNNKMKKYNVSNAILTALNLFDASEDGLIKAIEDRWNVFSAEGMTEDDAATRLACELLAGTGKVWGKPQWKQVGVWLYRSHFTWELFHRSMKKASAILYPEQTATPKDASSFSGKWMGLKSSPELWAIAPTKKKQGGGAKLNPAKIAADIHTLTAKLDGVVVGGKEWAEAKAAAALLLATFA